MDYTLNMTMMFAVHDALRRELERLARVAARTGDDPRRVLRAAAGWELFKRFLRVHHTTEDDVLWPAMHEALTERPDGLALLEVMEAEHAAIDPLLRGIDAAGESPLAQQSRRRSVENSTFEATHSHPHHTLRIPFCPCHP